MPIYEYFCEKCETTFETMQSISAKPLKTCQGLGCNAKENGKVRRLVSASGFILKGSGWYVNDYPSETRKQGWEKETKSANPGNASAPAAGDSAPAAPAGAPAPTQAKPVEKKPVQKNPYSGGKRNQAKASK